MFFHIENQQLLWQTLQKSPYLVEFSQKYAGHKETWFRGISEQFYSMWLNRTGVVPSSAKDLLAMNKQALTFFIADLKRLLGYDSLNASLEPKAISFVPRAASLNASLNASLEPYNVAGEKQKREERRSSEFNAYQEQYSRLLQRPTVPSRGIPSESAADQKIKNMDELLAEQVKLRELDLELCRSPEDMARGKVSGEAQDGDRLVSSNRLKILEDMAREEIEKDALTIDDRPKKVSWSEDVSI